MPAITPAIINTLQGYADVDATHATTDERIMRTMTMRQQYDMQKNLQKLFEADSAAPPPGTGNAASPAGDLNAPVDASDPISAQYKQVQGRQQQYEKLARIYRQAGSMAAAEKYDTLAKDEDVNLRQMSEKMFDTNNTKLKEAWQAMQGVHDSASLDSALRYLVANTPKQGAQIIRQVPFTDDGVPIYNDQTKALIDNAGNQFKTMHERATEAQAQKSEADRVAARKDAHDDRMQTILHADTRAAQSRSLGEARLAEQKRRTDLMAGQRDEKQIRIDERDAQADLNKSEFVKNFDKYQQGHNAAKNVNDILQNPDRFPDIRSVSVPAVTTMMQSYPQMVQNYRSLMGTRVSQQQTDQMQGLLEKARAYLSNIGRGKVADIGVVREVATEMGRMYQDTNAAVMKNTLELRARVAKKGGDPNSVISPASLSEALRTGRAELWKDPKDGQSYARFEPKKEKPGKEDIVPIYDQPVRKKGRIPSEDEEE